MRLNLELWSRPLQSALVRECYGIMQCDVREVMHPCLVVTDVQEAKEIKSTLFCLGAPRTINPSSSMLDEPLSLLCNQNGKKTIMSNLLGQELINQNPLLQVSKWYNADVYKAARLLWSLYCDGPQAESRSKTRDCRKLPLFEDYCIYNPLVRYNSFELVVKQCRHKPLKTHLIHPDV